MTVKRAFFDLIGHRDDRDDDDDEEITSVRPYDVTMRQRHF